MISSSTRGTQIFQISALILSMTAVLIYEWNLTALLVIVLGYFMYGCLGIVVMYHRCLTHGSYQTHPILVKLLSVLGCLAGTGSPLAWIAIHINHHLNSDKPNDPHSPHHHGLTMFLLNYHSGVSPKTKWRMRNIISDRFQQFLHRYYFAIVIVYSLILLVIGGFWLMVFLHLLPATITAIMSNIVNYIGHKPHWVGGYRRYNLQDQSSNNWLFAIPSWGETWHNNHHRYPKKFSCGHRWWEIDISAYIIKLIKI